VARSGNVWRINATGLNPTKIATITGSAELESGTVVPNNPGQYGPLAGTIVVADEGQAALDAITPAGTVTLVNLGISHLERVQVVDPTENFFGIDQDNSVILGAAAADLTWMGGDLLVNSEGTASPALTRVSYTGAALQTQALTLGPGSATLSRWEKFTFAPIGVGPLVPPAAGMGSLAGSVYDDLNNDGRQQPGEPGIDGVTVTLTGTTTQGNAVTLSTTTGASGSYDFGHLWPGTYSILKSTPAGSIEGKDTHGTLGGTAGIGRIDGITMTPGAVGTGYLFGLDRPPHFTTTPVTQASSPSQQLPRPYVYNAGATDPDGDPLTFTLL